MTYITNKNEFKQIALGNVAGKKRIGVGGNRIGLKSGTREIIASQGGIYTYLPTNADTLLYMSSDDASDIGQVFAVVGLSNIGGDFIEVARTVTIGGQNQVALNAGMIRSYVAFNIGATEAMGNLYLATESTGGDLVNGVPQTASKIKAKILKGTQLESLPLYTVPSNKKAYVQQVEGAISKVLNTKILARTRFAGGVFGQAPAFPVKTNVFSFFKDYGFQITEKWDIEFSIITDDPGADVLILTTLTIEDVI